jgi:predicted phosphoribosyltransferase
VRKLGVPGYEELAMGAVASGGVLVLNDDVVASASVPKRKLDAVIGRESREVERREVRYRGGREPIALAGRTTILVDDGLATGATMRAAVVAVRRRGASAVVVAVPVGAPETCSRIAAIAEELVCLCRPESFVAVGFWYRQFDPTSDAEVRSLLRDADGGATSRQDRGCGWPAA